MADAAGQLRVSMVTMRKILNDERLQTYRDPRNGRVRLLRVDDVERLTQPVPREKPPSRRGSIGLGERLFNTPRPV